MPDEPYGPYDELSALRDMALRGSVDAIHDLYLLARKAEPKKSAASADDLIVAACSRVIAATDPDWFVQNPGKRPPRFKADILEIVGSRVDARTVQRFINDDIKMASIWAVADFPPVE